MILKLSLVLWLFFGMAILFTGTAVLREKKGPSSLPPTSDVLPDLTDLPRLSQTRPCDPLTPCRNDATCAASCGPETECTTISASRDGAPPVLGPDRQPLPPGRWCLPAGLNRLKCQRHAGQSLWMGDRAGWVCRCLYPDVFGGSDCSRQIACRPPPSLTGLPVPRGELKHVDTGHVWDPTRAGFVSAGTTPYDQGYRCVCPEGTTSLPGDLRRCHRDPCTSLHEIPMWDPVRRKCDCTTQGATNNQYAYSNVTRQCVRTPQCNWNDTTQRCMCPEGKVARVCDSDTMKRRSGVPRCPSLPGGSYCVDPCEGYCMNGAKGRVVGTRCVCDCDAVNDVKNTNVRVWGQRCQNSCLKSGTAYVPNSGRECCKRVRKVIRPPYPIHFVCL